MLFQRRFFWCCLTRCLWKTRHPTRWLLYGLGTEHAACHTGPDTAQTERVLMRLVDTSSLDSRLHHSGKRVFARHPCIELVFSCCLCQCCTHDSSFLLSPYSAHLPFFSSSFYYSLFLFFFFFFFSSFLRFSLFSFSFSFYFLFLFLKKTFFSYLNFYPKLVRKPLDERSAWIFIRSWLAQAIS